MKEIGKERELLKGSCPEILFISKERSLLQCLFGAFIAKPPLQNTQKKPKKILLQWGQIREKTKK